MSGHRRHMRRRSSESWSSGSGSMQASTRDTDDDVHVGGHRRQRRKRSSASLPVQRSPAARHHSWVLLNRAGARRDGFPGDRTTSATSRTPSGEEISVSFDLVEPPGTSVLTFDWTLLPSSPPPRMSTMDVVAAHGDVPQRVSTGDVVAAHRDVLLLAMRSYENTFWGPSRSATDLFVYQASRDRDPSSRRRPSLLWLPYSRSLEKGGIGIMSCTSNDVEDDVDSPAFVVAELKISWPGTTDVRLFRSGAGQWVSFQNLHVRGANNGDDLCWWSTDAVVPYRRRYMIWVDYYRGMVLMDLSSCLGTHDLEHSSTPGRNPMPPPRLRFVPLPVDRVDEPKDGETGSRGNPKACRGVCVTRHGVKFVSIDTQHWSNFGVGHWDVLKGNRRFRITTWSLREDEYTWRKDLTMHEEEFWDAFDGGDRFPFPHARPKFPVVDMDNPVVIIFRLEESDNPHDPKWMIEVDLRKKVLLAATAYTKKKSDGLSCDEEAINSARMKSGFDPIPSELPRYLDGGQASQASKKRRR